MHALREKVLARPGSAANQHGGVNLRKFLGNALDFGHFLRNSQNAVKPVLGHRPFRIEFFADFLFHLDNPRSFLKCDDGAGDFIGHFDRGKVQKDIDLIQQQDVSPILPSLHHATVNIVFR